MSQTVFQGISEDLHPHSSPAAETERPGPAPGVRRPVQVMLERLLNLRSPAVGCDFP